jgi:PAS domain S-box-containing protein
MFETRVELGMRAVADRYARLLSGTLDGHALALWLAVAAAAAAAAAGFAADRAIVATLDRELETFRALLLRAPPLAFVDAVFGRDAGAAPRLMTGSQAVFETSPDAMLALSREGVIENLNAGACALFGFTPEQMLGQELAFVINENVTANSNLYYTIKLMRTGQSQLVYETEVLGTRDDESSVPLRVVLVGFAFAGDARPAESFALICKDLSTEHRDNELVDEAKRETERLLHALVPAEMLTRIANHEPRATLAAASVLVINIAQARKYVIAAGDAPAASLAYVKRLFAAFDDELRDFRAIAKVRIVGDVYLAAAGVFAADTDVVPCAHELLHFALSCLDSAEEVNVQAGTAVQLRMGIHTGGPLFIGVVDDRIVFNVVGGPIRTAFWMEGQAIPGTVNISAATYECVSNGSFHIEKHEDVEMPEVGVTATYTVRPGQKLSRQGSKRTKSGFGLSRAMSGHGSMFQVPSVEGLIAACAQETPDSDADDVADPYDGPSIDNDA